MYYERLGAIAHAGTLHLLDNPLSFRMNHCGTSHYEVSKIFYKSYTPQSLCSSSALRASDLRNRLPQQRLGFAQ